jgi:hypothetical protein
LAPTLVSQKLKARGLIPDISKLSKRGDASQKESTAAHKNAGSKQIGPGFKLKLVRVLLTDAP